MSHILLAVGAIEFVYSRGKPIISLRTRYQNYSEDTFLNIRVQLDPDTLVKTINISYVAYNKYYYRRN